MKHNIKITAIILAMFVVTQFIGLYVVDYYSPIKVVDGEIQNVTAPDLPFGMESPEIEKESDYYSLFFGIIIAFIIAISLLFLFTKFKIELLLKIWFFVVMLIALGISFSVFTSKLGIEKVLFNILPIVALLIALPLVIIKIFKREFIVHNATELFIYPGIAAVFVPILNIYTIIALLILISIYDMWAVWKSGIMQKMAKYQINTLNIFGGFIVPYASKQMRQKIKHMKKTLSKEELKKKKIKINIAMLGGGDVIFPLITAGVMLKTFGFYSALLVIAGATLGLSYLLFFSEKKKFYPAMPFITAGIFLGMLVSWLL